MYLIQTKVLILNHILKNHENLYFSLSTLNINEQNNILKHKKDYISLNKKSSYSAFWQATFQSIHHLHLVKSSPIKAEIQS